ncbi:MAG: thioredoxin domain-containing protein [Acidobacteria bacterium]|nr:thioredoxin domain-containing protein [Acidobacteriota bacterium]MYK88043.1 thioredoxin domain-containing protein [Acidobacteriota bacterium]
MPAATTCLVEWRPWGRAAFDEARAEQVPVLLALGPRWCPASAAMMGGAYADPRVADLIDDRFVPVRVDAEERPDIGERYGLGAWPTTAFLTPDGRVLGGETYATAERMRGLLPRVADAFEQQRDAIAERVAAPATQPAGRVAAAPDPDVDAWVGDRLLAQFDEQHGGFGVGAKRVHAAALELAWRRAGDGDEVFAAVVEPTLRAMARGGLYDELDGGVFRYCARRDWTEPATEKLLDVNADALRLFLLPDDDGCLDRAIGVVGYVRRTLADLTPDHPGFFASQRGDPDYYRPRAEADAPAAGPPAVDRAVYADGTALMARAFAAASETLRDSSLLEFAVDAMEHVVAGTYERGGGIAHRAGSRAGVRGLLSDQVRAAAALLDLHALTDREVYLDMAQELMHFAIQHLWDPSGGGGFLDRVHGPEDIGLLREPLQPFAVNCEAARVLLRLATITADPAFRDRAVATLAAQTAAARAHGVDAAPYALAVRDLLDVD